MKETKLNVEGMACNHCANSVRAELMEIEGVKEVIVSLEEKTVTVKHTEDVTYNQLQSGIEDLGYEVR